MASTPFSESDNKWSDEATNYTCDEHKGRSYEMYCKEHGEIFCALCILKHRQCEGVEHISRIAKKLLQQQNKHEIISCLINLSTELQGIKSRLSDFLKEMNSEESNIIDAINTFKEKMLKRIEEEAKSSITKIKSRYKSIGDDIDSELMMVDRVHEDIKKFMAKLERNVYIDDTEHFVTMKLADCKTKVGREYVLRLLWKPMERNVFEFNSNFETFLNESSFGEFKFSERPLGEVVNILAVSDTDSVISAIRPLQSDLLKTGIHSKIIEIDDFNAIVPTVCVVSSYYELRHVLYHTESLNEQPMIKIPMLCLTSFRLKDPESTFLGNLGKLFGSRQPVEDHNYSRGYADFLCSRVETSFVYIDTEDVSNSQRDRADAIQFLKRIYFDSDV